jgi:Na+-translocating ferredoxin:NAD+ oxidoreductase RnfG subunit
MMQRLLAIALFALPLFATQYLSTEQAQRVLFPEADRFVAVPVKLTAQQKAAVEKHAGIKMRTDSQPVWRAESHGALAGWFIVDEVFGKHEFITYAVALDASGKVRAIEILDYRETHGGEVRNERWRAQFKGKSYGDALKLGKDIQNISGATLSCKHVSEGVRRVLAIHDLVLK